MKEILLFVFLICFSSCQREAEFPSNSLNGEYAGVLYITRGNGVNEPQNFQHDTFDLQFKLTLPSFAHGGCTGNASVNADTINFVSNECGCWCDCSPLIDCGGDFLLGPKIFSFSEDSLKMDAEGAGSYPSGLPGVSWAWSSKFEYRLKKLN